MEDQHGSAVELEVLVDQATHVLEQGCWARTEVPQSLKNPLPTNGVGVIRSKGEGWRLCHLAIMPLLFVSCPARRQAVAQLTPFTRERRSTPAPAHLRSGGGEPEQRPQTCPTSADAVAAATNAADTARERVAEHLLVVRLKQLHERSTASAARPASWSERLPDLAGRPLDGDATGRVIA
ncbi:hypothetical protein ACIRRX_30230 [Streptomyces bacillaris]